jgi:histidinol phosphatase-like enzyme
MHSHSLRLATTRDLPRGLFIDRWGTLCELPKGGFAKRPSDVEFTPGALDALFQASRVGWNLYLIGNEESVAFGHVSEAEWNKIDAHIADRLANHGVKLTRSYASLEHPDINGTPGQPSVFRLPETGAFYHALHNDRVELTKSWVIGDSTLELAAGWRADMRTIGLGMADKELSVDPAIVVPTLADAIACLMRAGAEAA